jgi:hypothetical protein
VGGGDRHAGRGAAAGRVREAGAGSRRAIIWSIRPRCVLDIDSASDTTPSTQLGDDLRPDPSSRTRNQNWARRPAPSAAPRRPPRPPRRINGGANYVEKPTTHRVNNIGTTLFRLIGIANMTPGDATSPAAASPAKPEMENRWYRVERLVIAPGSSAPVPTFAGTIVVVMQTNGSAALDGKVWHPLNGPGDFARIDGTTAYVVHNRGASEIELVAIAVKGAK